MLAALPLAGCGFTPALAPGAPAAAPRGRIRADDPADRAGVAFVQRLEERLGRPATADWTLAWEMEQTETRAGLAPGVGETRAQIAGRLRWALTPAGADAPVARGTARQTAGYSLTSTPLATRAAAEDARRRLAVLLADAVAAELIATAGDWSG